jgi:hypothetical protein
MATLENTTVKITGDTYPVRHALGGTWIGGEWDKERKAWIVPASKAALARLIVRNGSSLIRVRKPDGATGSADLSRPVWCSCEQELPESERTPFKLEGETFTHTCGKRVEIIIEKHKHYARRRQCECDEYGCCRPACRCESHCVCRGGNVYDCMG